MDAAAQHKDATQAKTQKKTHNNKNSFRRLSPARCFLKLVLVVVSSSSSLLLLLLLLLVLHLHLHLLLLVLRLSE